MPDHEEDFFTTRRIDIPPDLRDQIELARRSTTPETRRSKVIRVPKTQVGPKPLGSPDFQQLLQNIYDAVLITDAAGQIFGANVRAIQFFQYDVADLCRHNILDLISGATSDALASVRQTLQSDRFVLIQAYCARQDGSLFPAEISVNRLPLGDKEYLSFFVRDVTLRKEAENRLRTGFTAIQNAASGILITGPDGTIQYANPSMARFWAMEEPAQLVGMSLHELLGNDEFATEVMETARRGETISEEITVPGPEDSEAYAQLSVAPNFDTEGDFVGVVLSLLDISNLKKAQRKLEEYAAELHRKNLEMESDLQMAREVQVTFLPRDIRAFPMGAEDRPPAVSFTNLYLPSGLVGGDFYDIIPLSNTEVGILVADVVGHGMRAALVVATLRGLIEQLVREAAEPAAFLRQLNLAYSRIFRHIDDRMFATMFYGTYDIRTARLTYSCGGHLPPYVLRRKQGRVQTLEVRGAVQGAAIGLYEDSTYAADTLTFDPDDTLLLYTDGLSENLNEANEYFESEKLPDCLRRHLGEEDEKILSALIADARAFSGRTEFEDDVCLLAARFGPPIRA